MINVNIDFDNANKITRELNNTTTDMSNISSKANSISADGFASFSPGTVSLNESFKSQLGNVVPNCNNLSSKFSKSIDLYYQAYEEQKRKVEDEIVQKSVNDKLINDVNEFGTPMNRIASAGSVTISLSDEKASEIRETTKFYYGYPGDVSEVHEISSEKLAELFEKNGATKIGNAIVTNSDKKGKQATRDGENWYMFEKDGHNYQYNVDTNEIIVDYETPSKDRLSWKFSAKFFVTDDTDFDAITNTITACGGQGILEVDEPRYDNNPARTLLTGINANKNSLVIVPYGHGYGSNGYNIAPGVASSTIIGDFISGSNNKEIRNSIVGFSLGGQTAYETVGQNKGLYSTLVACNTSMQGGLIDRGGDYSNFDGVKIITIETFNDQTDLAKFQIWHGNTIKGLYSNGVNMDNVYVVTNNATFEKNIRKYVSEDHISDFNGAKWSGHNCGPALLKDCGIFAYLSEDR